MWRQQGDEVDLLITDIVMPDGMNGVELAERLRRSRPELKVIYTSGYLADLSREDIARHHSDAYIAKPFSLSSWRGWSVTPSMAVSPPCPHRRARRCVLS